MTPEFVERRISEVDYNREWAAGWPNIHPEDYCQRCGNRNAGSWTVDGDRFKAAMEALGFRGTSIVCPSCFVEGHEKATGLTTTWQLVPYSPFRFVAEAST